MAFCNSCGAVLTPGTNLCNKCGSAIAAGPVTSAAVPAPTSPPTGGSSGFKIVLIVVAVVVAIGILGLVTLGIIGVHIARSTHVRQEGDHVKVDTPFGTVETSQDPEKVAQEIGVEVYPGAQPQKNDSSSATFGAVHTATAVFQSADSLDKVCSFYKSKFPNSAVTTSDQNRCTIVSNDQKNMTTISIETSGDMTKFSITTVSKKPSN
jgi:F0F1-type ATP synthase membrane subunit c/vacuolar-type H+-ATPase subunit K